jgi:hypothetical protein
MKTRRQRRIRNRRVRRVLASVTTLGLVGLGVGLAVPAGANNGVDYNDGPGAYLQGNYNCTGDYQATSGNAQNRGASYHSSAYC